LIRETAPFDQDFHLHVTLEVYDVSARLIDTLVDAPLDPGSYQLKVHAADLAPGVYTCKFRAGDYQETKRLIRTKE